MAATAHLLLSALASAEIVGIGGQYLALLVLGVFAKLGWVAPVGASNFVAIGVKLRIAGGCAACESERGGR